MRSFVPIILLIVSLAPPAFAQEALSLQEAVARARSANPSARAAAAGVEESSARVTESRAGWWPRVDASETVQRGDLPVYAFSTLLSQRRFSEADFAIATLNHPDPLTNHRAAVTVQHALFDSQRRLGTDTARLAADIARETERSLGRARGAARPRRPTRCAASRVP